jgi:nitrile hydratase
MDGIHDLGGKQGYGPVRYTLNATAFHSPWEVRVNAMYAHAVRSGIFNMDEYRHAIERMDPRHYLTASYYERSLTSLATLLVEKGVVAREELERRANGAFPLSSPSAPGRGNAPARQRFKPGDRVRVKLDFVPGHIRLPAYIRGKVGTVVGESPAYPFPMRTPTASTPRTSPRTTCVSARRTCGRTAAIRRWFTWACSRATWSARREIRGLEIALDVRGDAPSNVRPTGVASSSSTPRSFRVAALASSRLKARSFPARHVLRDGEIVRIQAETANTIGVAFGRFTIGLSAFGKDRRGFIDGIRVVAVGLVERRILPDGVEPLRPIALIAIRSTSADMTISSAASGCLPWSAWLPMMMKRFSPVISPAARSTWSTCRFFIEPRDFPARSSPT